MFTWHFTSHRILGSLENKYRRNLVSPSGFGASVYLCWVEIKYLAKYCSISLTSYRIFIIFRIAAGIIMKIDNRFMVFSRPRISMEYLGMNNFMIVLRSSLEVNANMGTFSYIFMHIFY